MSFNVCFTVFWLFLLHTEGNTVGAGEQGKVVLDVLGKNVHLSRPSSQKKNLVEDDGTLLDKNNT